MTPNTLARTLVAGAFVTASSFALAAAPTLRQILQTALPSVVVLVTEDEAGRELTLGSGFFVGEGVIAAGLHLLDGARGGYYKHIGYKKRFPIEGIVGIDRANDLVLLSAPGARARALALGDSRQVSIGDPVYVLGNPGGLEGSLSQGILSGIREVGERTVLQITAPLSPGSSGSAVLNASGEVIGMANATAGTGQNLNFAVPVSYLQALLKNREPVISLAAYAEQAQPPPPAATPEEKEADVLIATHFTWDRYGRAGRYYSFSLRNRLPRPVRQIQYLVAFSDRKGEPVDVQAGYYSGVIPPGLAKRVNGALEVYTSDLAEKVDVKVVSFAFAD